MVIPYFISPGTEWLIKLLLRAIISLPVSRHFLGGLDFLNSTFSILHDSRVLQCSIHSVKLFMVNFSSYVLHRIFRLVLCSSSCKASCKLTCGGGGVIGSWIFFLDFPRLCVWFPSIISNCPPCNWGVPLTGCAWRAMLIFAEILQYSPLVRLSVQSYNCIGPITIDTKSCRWVYWSIRDSRRERPAVM